MPIYDYKCKNGHIFDEVCSIKDRKEPKECIECGEKAKFVFSVNGVKPHFGNKDTQWTMREKKRLSETDKKGNYRNKFSGHI